MTTPPTPKSLEEVLDDLCSRFIINLPNEELESFDRLCFQIEAAHWFYLDFFREEFPSLPVFNLKEFARQMFQHCPLLQPFRGSVEQILANFTQYKVRVPACGAIILNPTLDKCLLVKGWTNRSSWGFPKGKINKDEFESDCAVREVFEETSFDITPYLREEDHIELILRETEQKVKLFIIAGVPEDTPFVPRTRKEISKISWFPISEFKTDKNPSTPSGREGRGLLPTPSPSFPPPFGGAGTTVAATKTKKYFMVIPFISKLRVWLKRKKHLRKPLHAPSDNSIITAYDSTLHTMPHPSSFPPPPPPSSAPLAPVPSSSSSQNPLSSSKGFVPLAEPISLMHLLTPTPRHASMPDISNPTNGYQRPHPSLPLPLPLTAHVPLPLPTPYPSLPPPPHASQTSPPRASFHTPPPPSSHPPPPQTYPYLPHHNKHPTTPQGTPQPKTQPSSPYTPYPLSPPTSPTRARAQVASPVQLMLTGKDPKARRPNMRPRRVDFGGENKKGGNAFTNFHLNADEIMKCFVHL